MCVLFCLDLSSSWATAAEANALSLALDSISTDDLFKHVRVLADDTLEGRDTGSRGSRAAAGYLQQRLIEAKLTPLGGDGGFFQPFGAGCINILAKLEGSDPALAKEVVLLCAHYDHVGYGNPRNSYGPFGYIHNGADDNASGIAGLLEIIDACRHLPSAPRRSLVFAFWDGEEKGLLGSKHWVENPTVPLSQIACAINLDMIGRMRDNVVEVYGARTSSGMRQCICRANDDPLLRLVFSWEMKENSDHYTFFKKNIPVIMFHTRLHEDYHRPSDDIEKLNQEGMRQTTRLLLNTTYALANGESRAQFRDDSRGENESSRVLMEAATPPPPARLGISWATPKPKHEEIVITNVTSGSPADKAGLRIGDQLLQLNDWEIDSENNFRRRLLSSPSESTIVFKRAESNEPETTSVVLAGKPIRLGVSWRIDPADPNSAIVIQVVPGSAAAQAGFLLGDRIYEVQGKKVIGSDELLEQFSQASGDVEILLERSGRLLPAKCELPPRIPAPK